VAEPVRISALHGHAGGRRLGSAAAADTPGVILGEAGGLVLHQIAAWPDCLDAVGKIAARAAGVDAAPGPGRAAELAAAALRDAVG